VEEEYPVRIRAVPYTCALRVSVGCLVLALTGCQTAYYATMEKLGYHKRDILVSRVEEARTSQEEAKAQFQSALDRFRQVVQVPSSALEATYTQLKAEFDRSEAAAHAVQTRIAAVEEVAEALFAEWAAELPQYTNDTLRRASARQLAHTRQRYTPLIGAMKRAATTMTPVLAAFRDQVLFLKHHLNTQAIAAVQRELVTVETDIAALIRAMEAAIAEANAFLKATHLEEGAR
jgi:hypothetical protein